MAIGGPATPSSGRFYVERMPQSRTPTTPAAPSNLDGRFAAGQNDPGPAPAVPIAGDGLALGGLFGITVSLWPNVGLTITGGSLLCWIWSPFTQNWARSPDLDLTVTAGTYTGPAGYIFQPMKVQNRLGFLINFLSTSGSTPITGTSTDFLLRIDGFTSVLGQG